MSGNDKVRLYYVKNDDDLWWWVYENFVSSLLYIMKINIKGYCIKLK